MLAIGQELYLLKDVDAMANSNSPSLDSNLYVFDFMILGLSCMVHFFVVEMRIF